MNDDHVNDCHEDGKRNKNRHIVGKFLETAEQFHMVMNPMGQGIQQNGNNQRNGEGK